MLPLSRKSVEPMAARVDPMHVSARHQSRHHFVAKAEWSCDRAGAAAEMQRLRPVTAEP
jgi:SRSO17 transposase